jgi:hypothetical protein
MWIFIPDFLERTDTMTENMEDKLLVLWTSGDKNVAMNMVLMYTHNAKLHDWWADVTLLIWGSSGQLLIEDAEVQAKLADMKEAGVDIIACRRCAENMGIVGKLEQLGVNVFYTGQFLTDWLKSGKKHITI